MLECEDVKQLLLLKEQAKEAGMIAMLIEDAGHTEIPAGTITVLGIGPAPKSSIDDLVKHLKLVS